MKSTATMASTTSHHGTTKAAPCGPGGLGPGPRPGFDARWTATGGGGGAEAGSTGRRGVAPGWGAPMGSCLWWYHVVPMATKKLSTMEAPLTWG